MTTLRRKSIEDVQSYVDWLGTKGKIEGIGSKMREIKEGIAFDFNTKKPYEVLQLVFSIPEMLQLHTATLSIPEAEILRAQLNLILNKRSKGEQGQ